MEINIFLKGCDRRIFPPDGSIILASLEAWFTSKSAEVRRTEEKCMGGIMDQTQEWHFIG